MMSMNNPVVESDHKPSMLREMVSVDSIPRESRFSPVSTVMSVLLVYIAGWGVGLLSAIYVLSVGIDKVMEDVNKSSASDQTYISNLTVQASTFIIAASIAAFVCKRRGVKWRDLAPRRLTSGREATASMGTGMILVLIFLLSTIGFLAAFGSDNRYPSETGYHSPYQVVSAFVGAFTNGFGEEVLVMAFPTYMLRKSNLSWKFIIPLLVALRVGFHLYYGVGSFGVAIWATCVLLAYRSGMRLQGIIAAHALFDFSSMMSSILNSGLPTLTFFVLALGFIGSYIVLWRRDAEGVRVRNASAGKEPIIHV